MNYLHRRHCTVFGLLLVLAIGFQYRSIAQSNFRIGFATGLGSSGISAKAHQRLVGGKSTHRSSATKPKIIQIAWQPVKGWGFSTGIENTYQNLSRSYFHEEAQTSVSLGNDFQRWSIPLMLTYRNWISKKHYLAGLVELGGAIGLQEVNKNDPNRKGRYFAGDPTGRLGARSAWAYRHHSPSVLSASLRMTLAFSLDLVGGGRLDWGASGRLGLRSLYEGEFYFLEASPDASYAPNSDFQDFVDEQTITDHYELTSKGSFAVLFVRYWLPKFYLARKKRDKTPVD